MRKLFGGCLAVFVLVLAGVYGFLLASPTIHHPEALAAARTGAEARFKAAQAEAQNPELNGFLSEVMLPWWGRRGKEFKEKSAPELAVQLWLRVSEPESGGALVEHDKLMAAKDPKYLEALAGMEKFAPEIQKRMSMLIFVTPEARISANNPVPNLIAMRSCATALARLAQAYVEFGKPQEALPLITAPVSMGFAMEARGSGLIYDMIGTVMQEKGCEAYAGLIDPHGAIPAEVWKEAAKSLTAHVPVGNLYQTGLQDEYVAATSAVDEALNGGKLQDIELPALFRLPGILIRERRILDNQTADMLAAAEAGQPLPRPEELTFGTYLTGKSGLLTDLVTVPGETTAAAISRTRARVAATATCAGVACYLAEKKSLPNDLAQVRQVCEIPSDEVLKESGVVYTLEGKKATLTVPYVNPSQKNYIETFGDKPWFKRDAQGLIFLF